MQRMATHKALNYVGRVTPSTRAKITEVLDALEAETGKTLDHVWGYDPNKSNTEHHSGRAADFMVHGDKAAGDWIAAYVWKHRKRLGLRHVIWYQRIRSTLIVVGIWRKMADRGSVTANHMDHPHVLFNDTPYRAPAKPAAPAKPTPAAQLLRRGSRGTAVRRLQSGLRRVFPAYAGRLAVDGLFGPATEAAVREFQRRSALGVDGIVGPATARRLASFGIRL